MKQKVRQWHRDFRHGRKNVLDEFRSGSTAFKPKKLLLECTKNCHVIVDYKKDQRMSSGRAARFYEERLNELIQRYEKFLEVKSDYVEK